MTITQTLTPPPAAPDRDTMAKAAFDSAVDLRLAWDATNVTETTALVGQINAFEIAGTLTETQGTSATSNSIGTGAKTFEVAAGKSWVAGMWLVIADTAAPTSNAMFGQITSYSGTSLVMNITQIQGSGTKTAWTISQSSPATAGAATIGTPVASTSGTSVTFTGIPSGTKYIVVSFSAVSTNGTTTPCITIGDAGGTETSGYSSLSQLLDNGVAPASDSTTVSFIINSNMAANSLSGSMVLTLENSSTFAWIAHGMFKTGSSMIICAGRKLLSAELTSVTITTTSGTDAFDAGEINIFYV
jgi:hypothetical protein